MLSDQPLTVTASVRNWVAREGGWITRSLGQALQLLSDVRYFADGSDEAIALRLQWHAIAMMFNPSLLVKPMVSFYFLHNYTLLF